MRSPFWRSARPAVKASRRGGDDRTLHSMMAKPSFARELATSQRVHRTNSPRLCRCPSLARLVGRFQHQPKRICHLGGSRVRQCTSHQTLQSAHVQALWMKSAATVRFQKSTHPSKTNGSLMKSESLASTKRDFITPLFQKTRPMFLGSILERSGTYFASKKRGELISRFSNPKFSETSICCSRYSR